MVSTVCPFLATKTFVFNYRAEEVEWKEIVVH